MGALFGGLLRGLWHDYSPLKNKRVLSYYLESSSFQELGSPRRRRGSVQGSYLEGAPRIILPRAALSSVNARHADGQRSCDPHAQFTRATALTDESPVR